jgi:hypothetical protein
MKTMQYLITQTTENSDVGLGGKIAMYILFFLSSRAVELNAW